MSVLYYRDSNGIFKPLPTIQGKSAYQGALEGGYRGTEEEFNQMLANLRTGYIPTPSYASVGQTIRVSAVDENGKPTEWEAVNFPEGGGGSGGSSGGIVEIANNADVSAVSSFSYSKDIDGNPLKVNDFWIVLDAPNNPKTDAWLELNVNGVRLINIFYYRNKQINLHTVIHKDYCEHTMYFSTRYAADGRYGYVGALNDDDDVIRFIGPVGSDLTNAEKTIQLKFNYGINDPAWGENARLWMWGE